MATTESISLAPHWGWQHSWPLLHLQTGREQVLARQGWGYVSVCTYLHVYVCVVVVVCECVCVYVCVYKSVWAQVWVHVRVCLCMHSHACVCISTRMPMYWCNTSISDILQWPDHAVRLLLGHIVEGDHRKGRLKRVLDGRAKLIQNKPHRNMLSEGALCTGNNAYVCQYIHIHLHLLHGCTTAYIHTHVRTYVL